MGCERENPGNRRRNSGLHMRTPRGSPPPTPTPPTLGLPVSLCGIQLVSVDDLWGTWFGGSSLRVSLNSDQIWDETVSQTPPPPILTPTVRPQITIEAGVTWILPPQHPPVQSPGACLWPRQPHADSCCSPGLRSCCWDQAGCRGRVHSLHGRLAAGAPDVGEPGAWG